MIEQVIISNYKTIRDIKLPLGRLNVLIGSNGVGKNNTISFFELTKAIYEQKFGNYTLTKGGIDNLFYNGRKISSKISGLIDFNNNNAFYFHLMSSQSNKGFIEETGEYFNAKGLSDKTYSLWSQTYWDKAVEESSLIENKFSSASA